MSLILWIQHSLTWTKPTPMIFALNSGNHHKAHKPSSLTWARQSDKLQHRPWIKTQKSKNITNHKQWTSSTKIYWTKSTKKKTTCSFSRVPSTSLSTTSLSYFDIFISWGHRAVRCTQAMTPEAWKIWKIAEIYGSQVASKRSRNFMKLPRTC